MATPTVLYCHIFIHNTTAVKNNLATFDDAFEFHIEILWKEIMHLS